MHFHYARLIETLHSAEMIKELLNDPDLLEGDRVIKGTKQEEGVGLIEAPRGTLFHHYKVNENDEVTMCNLIVSTTHNNVAMNTAVTKVAEEYISGVPEVTEGLLNRVEVAIRAYDPCLSCATHAMGKMPLAIKIVDAEGKLVDERSTF
jgi:NAD-reducing hydrogenase large subunit